MVAWWTDESIHFRYPICMNKIRVLTRFGNLKEGELLVRADKVVGRIYQVGGLPNLPVSEVVLKNAIRDYRGFVTAGKRPGKFVTAQKKAARKFLIELLNALAAYVQYIFAGIRERILATGFDANDGLISHANPRRPTLLKLTHIGNGISLAKVRADKRAFGFQWCCRLEVDGPWVLFGFSTNSADIRISGMTPGVVYLIYIRAVGSGNDNYSLFTDGVVHRAV